jgi:hypothetical protein
MLFLLKSGGIRRLNLIPVNLLRKSILSSNFSSTAAEKKELKSKENKEEKEEFYGIPYSKSGTRTKAKSTVELEEILNIYYTSQKALLEVSKRNQELFSSTCYLHFFTKALRLSMGFENRSRSQKKEEFPDIKSTAKKTHKNKNNKKKETFSRTKDINVVDLNTLLNQSEFESCFKRFNEVLENWPEFINPNHFIQIINLFLFASRNRLITPVIQHTFMNVCLQILFFSF